MFEEEEDPSSFAFAYDYSETTQLRSSSKSTGRRLIFSKFHNVSSCVWTRLNAFENVWACLKAFKRVWACLNVFERASASYMQAQLAWNYVISQKRDFAV